MKCSGYTILVILLVVMIIVAMSGWNLRPHGSRDFAGGTRLVLATYQGSDSTGMQPSVAGTDLVGRGEDLAHAADRIGCHPAPCGTPVAGGQAFNLPVSTRYSTNITPDQVAKRREEG